MGPLTQEDPIGIAGGLNLYGYAGGDPINYSDPFGLDACAELWPEDGANGDTSAWEDCKRKQYAETARQEAEAATQEAEFYENAECLFSGVAAVGALATDGVVAWSGLTLLKAAVGALTGPIWQAGLAWRGLAVGAGDRMVERGIVTGSKAASGYAGPPSQSFVASVRNAVVQTPRALGRAGRACFR
jgi:hypothetical protein